MREPRLPGVVALFLGIAAARVPGVARGSFRKPAVVVGDVILVLVPGEQCPKAGFLYAVIALVVIDRRNPFLYGQPVFGEETISGIATFLHEEAAPPTTDGAMQWFDRS